MATIALTTALTTVTAATIINLAASVSPGPAEPVGLPNFVGYSVPRTTSLEFTSLLLTLKAPS